ncbi:DUF4281 domain-containing protein [Waterburya agarophytonicola K14]|uniref:DUF4281 domain-containing protein n=1 Tax=Waterburya agarophytonicola KI4 TaxID=2874699 RepID=A0A964BLK7_9CYAN|nr:ABA4-like family protein [Waterburya agarophytonicola]MCC0175620.1 DUF4281 domain-containing protein [Waterburya agarophytonicola KI4]
MSFSQLFDISIFYATSFWILIIFLPNWNITQKIMKSYLPFIPLIILYAYFFFASFSLETALAFAAPKLDVFAKTLSQEGSAASTWVHFLVVDLFLGRWIYWQGQEKKIWIIHSLFLCLFFAPLGLLSHIITDALSSNNNNDDDLDKEDLEKT